MLCNSPHGCISAVPELQCEVVSSINPNQIPRFFDRNIIIAIQEHDPSEYQVSGHHFRRIPYVAAADNPTGLEIGSEPRNGFGETCANIESVGRSRNVGGGKFRFGLKITAQLESNGVSERRGHFALTGKHSLKIGV